MAGLIDQSPSVFARRCCWRFVVLFLAVACPAFSQAQETPAPTIRVDVNRVNVGVVVTNTNGKFVEGLQKSDFHIFDNGVEQPITEFLANDDPAQVVLMLECGPSMLFFGRENIQKADALIANLAVNDRVAIVCYSSEAQVLFELSADHPAARMFLGEMQFKSGFGDLNLTKSVMAVLSWLSTVPGKKTVVLIGSGVDSAPPESATVFQSNISASDVRILAVSTSLGFKKFPKKHKHDLDERDAKQKVKDTFKIADATLRSLAGSTGGHAYFSKSAKDYAKIYAEIAQIVRHEYSLSFAPQSLDGKLHTLQVTAKRGARVDYRQAYLAPSATPN